MEIKTVAKGTGFPHKQLEIAGTSSSQSGLNWINERKQGLTLARTWFWLGTSAVILTAFLALGTLRLVQESFFRLQKQHALIRATEQLLSELKDAEGGQRGYLLTGESSYLETYTASRRVLDSHLSALIELTGNNPSQREQVERLGPFIQQNLQELEQAIRTHDSAGFEAARAVLTSGRDQQLTEAIRRILQEIEDAEQRTLDQFTRIRQSRLRTGLVALLGSASLAVCSLLISQVELRRNISGRLRAEQELRASERRFESLCDHAPVGIFEADAAGRWTYANRRWSQISGLDEEASRGNGWLKALHPDDRKWVTEDWNTVAQQGASSEYRLLTPHGIVRWVRALGGSIRSETGELAAYVGTIEDVTERKQARHALEESRQELRALAGRLFLAQEEERRRLSRELHDDLSQKVALLAFDASSLAVSASSEAIKTFLPNLQARIAELSTDIRQIAHRLHPSILEDLGLTAALRELCEEFSARETTPAVFEQGEMPETLPVEVAACLYRLAQEALHNVRKHARASQVRMTVNGSTGNVHLCIKDDGVGFNAGSEAHPTGYGLGIISMKERVRMVQGEFSIESQPGQGTTLSVSVPLLPRREHGTPAGIISG
jgi:PAS domain S-box-containing protein